MRTAHCIQSAFLLVVALAVPALADEVPAAAGSRKETLVHGDVEHGGYGGLRMAFGRTADHGSALLGVEGGWIVNHHFILGGAASLLVSDQPAPGSFASTNNLVMGYGGLLIGSTLLPDTVVHPTFTVLVGGGGLGLRSRSGDGTSDLGDSFFVLEPALTLDVNVTTAFVLGASVSYRWVRSVETPGISNADLSGVFGTLALKFGVF